VQRISLVRPSSFSLQSLSPFFPFFFLLRLAFFSGELKERFREALTLFFCIIILSSFEKTSFAGGGAFRFSLLVSFLSLPLLLGVFDASTPFFPRFGRRRCLRFSGDLLLRLVHVC